MTKIDAPVGFTLEYVNLRGEFGWHYVRDAGENVHIIQRRRDGDWSGIYAIVLKTTH
jgi:hypothetical protein